LEFAFANKAYHCSYFRAKQAFLNQAVYAFKDACLSIYAFPEPFHTIWHQHTFVPSVIYKPLPSPDY
jgi:hypothetical protein